MEAVLNCLCYPFRKCCPCLTDTNTTRTKGTPKTGGTKKTDKKRSTTTDETTKTKTQKKSTKEDLLRITTQYKIPEDFNSMEHLFESQGLTRGEDLGRGAFAIVFKVTDNNGELMACKQLRMKTDSMDNSLSELKIMIRAKPNEHIIQVKKHFILSDINKNISFCFIFMEFANGGSVVDRMKITNKSGDIVLAPLKEDITKDYFQQTVDGLQFLHSIGIAHKDLKLLNILVFLRTDAKDLIKITDFGLSGLRYDTKKQRVLNDRDFVGTVENMSPQILRLYIYYNYNKKVDKLKEYNAFKADSWALGVCLYNMVTTKNPFQPNDNSFEEFLKMYQNMKASKYTITQKTKTNYSQNCLEMIRDLLEPNVSTRLPIDSLFNHKWLQLQQN